MRQFLTLRILCTPGPLSEHCRPHSTFAFRARLFAREGRVIAVSFALLLSSPSIDNRPYTVYPLWPLARIDFENAK